MQIFQRKRVHVLSSIEDSVFLIKIAKHQCTFGVAGVVSLTSFYGKLGAIRPDTCSVMFGVVWAQQVPQIDSSVNRDYGNAMLELNSVSKRVS